MKIAIQQIMLGPLCKNEQKTLQILKTLKSYGVSGIELNSFMIHPSSFLVRMLTKMAGMPTGNTGKLDWNKLVKESNLEVVSLHTDLGSLERDYKQVCFEAKSFGTNTLVVTGMYRFNYTNKEALDDFIKRMNKVGHLVKEEGCMLCYHNHNVEFKRLDEDTYVFDYLMNNFESGIVDFEFDTYWAVDAGIDSVSLMKDLKERLKLHHISDRGNRLDGPFMTPILKEDAVELGTGALPLKKYLEIDKLAKIPYVVLETHKNYIDKNRMKSIQMSVDYLKRNIK